MEHSATPAPTLLGLERMVVASVGITARALAEVAPELTFVQWRVLVLVDDPDGVAIGTIATALGAKIAAMSRLVGRLRTHGLVATQRSEVDARIVLVHLTELGLDLRDRVVERRRGELQAGIDDADLLPGTDRVLERLAAVLEGVM